MLNAGLVSIDPDRKWIGGRYYLQHLVRAVHLLPEDERVRLFDVWWQTAPKDDPFSEVRPLLDGQRVIAPPQGVVRRTVRRVRRAVNGWADTRDLFIDAGIDVVFPIVPCAMPGIAFVFWIPDFQYKHLPGLFPDDMKAWFDRHYDENGRAAERIAVSSESGLRDLERFLPHLAAKTRVLHFASLPTPEWTALDPASVAVQHSLPVKFFILSNQFSHHKNHMVVFEALRMLRDEDGIDAVVACTGSTYGFRGDDYMQRVDEFLDRHGLRNSVRILGLLSRAEQMALTRRAVAMLQPSRFEGWSTVVEDAKALGKRILLSDLEVHREQAPAAGTFLPLDDAAAWKRAMAEAFTSRSAGPHADEEERGRQDAVEAAIESGRAFTSILREAVAERR
jgi:glycosyltransferase involved in cell wall biosynthesis